MRQSIRTAVIGAILAAVLPGSAIAAENLITFFERNKDVYVTQGEWAVYLLKAVGKESDVKTTASQLDFIALLEKTGGLDLFTSMLAQLASPASLNGVVAFVTGLISSWSSTTGVVLPVFLPTAPGLVAKVGGGDPVAVAMSIGVGGSMVDVSPLSTLGALCVAAVTDPSDARLLFRKLLIWGLSMSVVGAILCQVFAGALARA